MSNALPDFYLLEDALIRLDADFSAAEVHGIYCGVLSINRESDGDELAQRIIQGDPYDYHFQELQRELTRLYSACMAQFNGDSLRMQLLLPEDGAPLDERLAALQKWCQGFAFGLALSGLSSMQALPEDSREWVEDVIKIGAAGEFDLEDEDASEAALAELEEFVSVGLLMLNEEMQPLTGMPETSPKVLH